MTRSAPATSGRSAASAIGSSPRARAAIAAGAGSRKRVAARAAGGRPATSARQRATVRAVSHAAGEPTAHAGVAERPALRPWVPRQHGAWAMLAVPLLLGVAATTASPWHFVLGTAALSGYLASATAQAWLRSRRRPSFLPSLVIYGAVFAVTAAILVAAFPALLLGALVIVPTGLAVVGGARPGTPRDLVNSVAQTAIALVLVPTAGAVSGAWDPAPVAAATVVAAGYLIGTIFVVRSVLRERGNRAFAAASVGFHAVFTIGAALALPWPYAAFFAALTARAAALPILERRQAGSARPIRPIHVGIVEIVASVALVTLAFAVPVAG